MNETSDDTVNQGNYGFKNMSDVEYDYMGSEGDEDFSKYLLDRMKQLESRNSKLKEQCDQIESEKKNVESQKVKYEREVRKLRSEINRLKTVPLIVANIIDVIDSNKVLIRSSSGPQFMVGVSQYIDESKLVAGVRVALNQQTLSIVDVLPSTEEPEVSAMEVLESQDISYEDIGGLDNQIQDIIECVELPLIKPESFERVGVEPPKGVLLHGPPGTGKTMMAKAVAHRTDATFIRVVGSELVQKYIGEGSRLVREVFDMARKKAPSIIFIDELDAIAAARLSDTNGADREVQRTLMQLLAEMDGFENRGDIRIIAATNRVDILDPAIIRPGRFDRMVEVPMPDKESRSLILKIHSRELTLARDVDFDKLAALTENTSGADLHALTTEAGMFAVRNDRDSVTMADFMDAIDKVLKPRQPQDNEHPGSMFV
ncbi:MULTISPECIES: proteasome-activating nucleotidase [Methanohalophilus]|jgi:proteasome regulatory subunit|uniref:Proteasome-activating nucleotidase n=1 Tax=Methanohalophilus euhalobius TaxID=51203 RepID=A0A314ZZR5_9EURY|nr:MULTISPECIES: proteasome-activating nucleotidase [Methanohalophilus]KXS45857.1 MAG: proteasome regulatory subunit [Methanohalophilus sp. T328-1]RSD33196.1 MAG: proteasome regulatory subunit [Methanohalophilus sp.]OBZ35926.1 MAG: proteasome-activating nucleotidase [Methanohalophilus sp. DAL1]PQV42185.1 proteasome-activating nucleotidase [Methanohalophilus euhalobius]RNI07182.1 AAA family ATPase [Methanohalophilus euhalobius]